MPLLQSKTAAKATPVSLPHTAGLFSDRNMDGAAIGTLVIVIDRAKNLPNLRSMGKQDPYCAVRLGKEAKKTETDRRGGQTPRWDQELRFTVYESVDYQKLKLSVFNEDKRTDLIGECWLELESIFQRGGGQADAWHDLNAKGRYAGQIRVELTYYDTRPREQAEEATPSTLADTSFHDPQQTSKMAGPRQPQVKRRPLPNSIGSSPLPTTPARTNSIPTPDNGPRSYHTPPQHTVSHSGVAYDSPTQSSYIRHSQRPQIPDHSISEPIVPTSEPYHVPSYDNNEHVNDQYYDHQSPQPYEMDAGQPYDQEIPYTDDPSALEAVYAQEQDIYDVQPPAPLRSSRGRAPDPYVTPLRPGPHSGPPHSHSAPILSPSEKIVPDPNSTAAAMRRHGYSQSSESYALPSTEFDDSVPPPPPTHRNSVPTVQRTPQTQSPMQVSSGPRRPLHHATNSQDFTAYNNRTYQAPNDSQANYASRYGGERRQSGDAMMSYNSQQDHGQQQQYAAQQATRHDSMASNSPSSIRGSDYNSAVRRPRPSSSIEHGGSTYGSSPVPQAAVSTASVPIVRPRPISPNVPDPHRTPPTSRNPMNTSPASAAPAPQQDDSTSATGSMPFSPDSFAQFNPQMQKDPKSAARSDVMLSDREATPMYSDQDTPNEPRLPKEAVKMDSFGRIVLASGRRVDPSDHLPSSTHAPEPEPKGADKERRSNVRVNIKARFGPREVNRVSAPPAPNSNEPSATPPHSQSAPPQPLSTRTPPSHVMNGHRQTPSSAPSMPNLRQTPPANRTPISTPPSVPASSPLQDIERNGRNRLQKRNPNAPSPLAPSPPAALNANNYYHNQATPPPVPSKIPLDAPSPQYPPYDSPYYDQNMPQEYAPQPMAPQIPPQQPRRHAGSRGYQVQPGSMANTSLSQEISQIDLGPSPSQAITDAESAPRYGGHAGGRLRRSRFGA